MSAIFLSASVPVAGRGSYYKTADPFLIQVAVRELMLTVLGRRLLVWGGHPAITPMVWKVCEDVGVDYSKTVLLYQSKFFEESFPEENKHFANVVYVKKVKNDKDASLLRLRETMLSRDDLEAAVFIGGMEGIESEYEIYKKFHPEGKVLAVHSPGGAARQLAEKLGARKGKRQGVDFARLFHTELGVAPDEPRKTIRPSNLRRVVHVATRSRIRDSVKRSSLNEAALRAFESAHEEFVHGRFAEAGNQFRILLEKYSQVKEVAARARTYLAIAESRLRTESMLPRDADSLYDRGVIELNRGEYVAAHEMFERALKREPEAAHIHYGLAATYARLGSVDLALESLQKALNLQPGLRVRAQKDHDLTRLRNDPEFDRLVSPSSH